MPCLKRWLSVIGNFLSIVDTYSKIKSGSMCCETQIGKLVPEVVKGLDKVHAELFKRYPSVIHTVKAFTLLEEDPCTKCVEGHVLSGIESQLNEHGISLKCMSMLSYRPKSKFFERHTKDGVVVINANVIVLAVEESKLRPLNLDIAAGMRSKMQHSRSDHKLHITERRLHRLYTL